MLYNPLIATVFYGGCALLALIATWRHEGKRQVGVVLTLCWFASNALWWMFPIEWRPAIFPILDVLFALTAMKAWKETGSRVPIILVALSTMAVAVNTAFGISGAVSWHTVSVYEITLNIIFVIQCLVTGAWGAADVVGGIAGLRASPADLRGHPQFYGRDDEAT